MTAVDYCVIGGGIVGVATAVSLLAADPGASLVLLEKESTLGRHQTGHNSGVIHSGIYYTPGSLKATLCRRGADLTKQFARDHHIAHHVIGKLIVATDERERGLMMRLFERSQHNGLDVTVLSANELTALEPNILGVGALHVPSAAVIDYGAVLAALARSVDRSGGSIVTGHAVTQISESDRSVDVETAAGRWTANRLVACAGLQADRVAALAGIRTDLRIVPFRGEYYRLPEQRAGMVGRLIYPVPDPELPFLGVHLSPTVHGDLTVGPNAVLGFAREGYGKFSVSPRDVRAMVGFPGLWRVAHTHARVGVKELRQSLWKRSYLQACRKYCPSLELDDLLPQEAGIRAQAVTRAGALVDDFRLEQTPRSIHVLDAPSPAATSALPIGELIARRLLGNNA